MKRFVVVLILAACSSHSVPSDPSTVCGDLPDDPTRPSNEVGDLGHLRFEFFSYEDEGQKSGVTDFDLVAGGSSTTVFVQARGTLSQPVTLTSSDASIGEVRAADGSAMQVGVAPVCHAFGQPSILAHGPGAFQLVATGADGTIVDTKTFRVATASSLGIASTTPKLVLLSSTQDVHATTYDAKGDILRGTGAVHFSTTGPLDVTRSSTGNTASSDGDFVTFVASALGSGTVGGDIGAVSEAMPITVIDESVIDALDVDVDSEGIEVDSGGGMYDVTLNVARVSATSKGAAVYGIACAWTFTPVYGVTANVLQSDSIATGEAKYAIIGNKTPVQATCTIAGGLSRTVTIPAGS